MHFFLGFGDELTKLAQAVKAYQDENGQWKFRPVAAQKLVPAPQPKFKPGSGYKPIKSAPTSAPKPAPKFKPSNTVGGRSRAAQELKRYMP